MLKPSPYLGILGILGVRGYDPHMATLYISWTLSPRGSMIFTRWSLSPLSIMSFDLTLMNNNK